MFKSKILKRTLVATALVAVAIIILVLLTYIPILAAKI